MTTSTFDIVSSIGIIISSLGVIAAFLVGARQISLARKAISAQSFLNLHQLEIASHGDGEDGIAAIAALAKYTNYPEFEKGVPDERKRDAIYRAVAFLNFVATLGEEGYLEVQDGWDIYFMAYWTSYKKLWHESTAWWLKHHRESHPNVFPSFERACLVTHAIPSDMSIAYDKRATVIERISNATPKRPFQNGQTDRLLKRVSLLTCLYTVMLWWLLGSSVQKFGDFSSMILLYYYTSL
jgi:hypothetical protein